MSEEESQLEQPIDGLSMQAYVRLFLERMATKGSFYERKSARVLLNTLGKPWTGKDASLANEAERGHLVDRRARMEEATKRAGKTRAFEVDGARARSFLAQYDIQDESEKLASLFEASRNEEREACARLVDAAAFFHWNLAAVCRPNLTENERESGERLDSLAKQIRARTKHSVFR